jgi:hypothetical protein
MGWKILITCFYMLDGSERDIGWIIFLHSFYSHNVMMHLGEQWQSLTLAEQSVLVDIFHSPQALFAFDSKPYHRAMNTFCKR